MGMNINIIILCARCRRGSRPAVSWCAMPLYMVVLPAFAPCPVIVPMLHVLPVYASPAAPHAHAVMLAAPCPAVPCLPDQRRPLPPRLPSCRVLVCYAFVYGRTARLCSLPCYCSYAPCIASVCQPCSSTRPCCNAGGFRSRADPAAPCPCFAHVRPLPHACRIYVYVSTCLHVYKLPPEMAYLSAKTDKQRQIRTGAIKPRPSYYQPFVSLSRSNNSFCLPASACRFIYSDNAASSSSPLPLPFAFT